MLEMKKSRIIRSIFFSFDAYVSLYSCLIHRTADMFIQNTVSHVFQIANKGKGEVHQQQQYFFHKPSPSLLLESFPYTQRVIKKYIL